MAPIGPRGSIEANTAAISTLDASVGDSSGGLVASVATLVDEVTSNRSAITTNSDDIAINVAAIESAESSIEANATDISTNAASITGVEDDLDTAETNIATNSTDIDAASDSGSRRAIIGLVFATAT